MTALNRKRILIGCITLAAAAVFAVAASIEYNRAVEAEKRTATNLLLVSKARIEALLSARIIGAQGLIVYARTHPELTQETYSDFARSLYGQADGVIRNLALLKDTTITHVYPFEGNETAVGRDLAQIPEQRDSVLYVKNTRRMLLTAPVALVQGGTGIIVRMPILSGTGSPTETYWGQLSLVFDYDGLLEKSGLSALGERYRIQISEKDPLTSTAHTIWSTGPDIPENSISETVYLHQVTWTLSMIPRAGWTGTTETFWALLWLGVLSSFLAGFGLNRLMAAKEELEQKVLERTEALSDTNSYLEQNMAELEESQADLTEVNERLQRSLTELQETQSQLITAEKLAALGELVAGVAHEINTPLGISVTLSSYLTKLHGELQEQYGKGALSREALEEYLAVADDAMNLMDLNLERASTLVTSFKHVATDQATLEKRRFNVREALQDVLRSLQPKFKNTGYRIELECDALLEVTSCPGALSQILTNLVMNSLLHGFADQAEGLIRISVRQELKGLALIYEDDGAGISGENLPKVFNPFFSTRKAAGSTGLGLHIIHNLVTQTLGGQISLHSRPGEGVHFRITFSDLA